MFQSQVLAASSDFKKTKIAVLDFQLEGQGFETQDMGVIVAEWFTTALVKSGRFEVIERGLLKKLLDEQKLSMSGVVDASTATKIGKFLGAQTIISGSVMKLQNIIEINARIIDVQTASIIAAENVKSTTTVKLQDLVVQMSGKIIKNFPLEGYIVNRSGLKVTIDLGKMAGVKEDMEFLVYKEGKVIKHPKTGAIIDVQRIETGKIKITSVRDKVAEGDILKEESPNSISYGQLVSNIAGDLEPVAQKAATTDKDLDKALSSSGSSSKTSDSGLIAGGSALFSRLSSSISSIASKTSDSPDDVTGMLRSSNFKDKEEAAKIIAKHYRNDEKILDVVNDELLQGYNSSSNDKDYVSAMAGLCNALGASGQAKYISTLETVSNSAPNRKLQKHALKNLKRLR
ncbi:FlgO family outer membrane protein [Desulfobacterium sp. N47]|uniref:FlgO family outer membrane protein n=1 Tax=Desulfobacterium sp. N47 TaxID=3115210 RepID=UPI003C8CBABE